ncbi:MAG TPA: DUF4363 family protein [Oscillospiraceae bacterium]|nr:DUF4363 family protein [Oscillospiraceae bacterium]
MRTVIITIIILIIFVVSAFVLHRYIDTSCDGLLDNVKELHVSVEKDRWSDSKKQLSSLNEEWENTKKRWQLFLEHYEMDDIDIVLSRLEQYLEIKDKPSALSETAELRVLINHIKYKEGFMLENIL